MRSDGTPKARVAMTLLTLVCALVAFAAAAGTAGAMPAMIGPRVDIGLLSFSNPDVAALAGDQVSWTNASVRAHTVTSDTGAFDSGTVAPGGTFSEKFATPGVYAYHCQIHPGMIGRVEVSRVLLDPVTQPAAPNVPLVLTGRAALPAGSNVTIEGDDGSGFQPLATAQVGSDGMFSAKVKPRTTTQFRAVPAGDGAPTDASPAERVLVVDRSVAARVVREHGKRYVVATVTPASPGSIVVLQMNLRQHFGWWPVAQARADKSSHARFLLPAGSSAPTRVVLTLRDGVTPLATSTTLRFARVAKRHAKPRHAHRR